MQPSQPPNFYLCPVMRKYEDTYRHKGLRKQLVDSLKQKGISDDRVLKASTPWIEDTREFFGLCLTSFALLMNYFYWRRKRLSS